MSESAERFVVVLGLAPLVAGAIWLITLRSPQPVAAYASGPLTPAMAGADEQTAVAPSEPRFLGVVVAGQDAALGAELAGQVVQVFAEPGATLRRGQPLVQLAAISALGARGMAEAQIAQDRSSEQAAELALENARDKLGRMSRASAAYASGDIQDARAEAARAEAELSKLRATSELQRASLRRDLARADKQIVRAPFDGVLASRWVDRGDFVNAGAQLARVVDHARFVRFAVPADAHARLRAGTSLSVRARTGAGAAVLTARLSSIEPELDPAAGLGFARAELSAESAEAAGLPPGARVQVTGAGLPEVQP